MKHAHTRWRLTMMLAATLLLPRASVAALDNHGETAWDGSTPPQGVYFHWYEPSFYTGFAPRTQDPQRTHIELSRGNQARVTMVLGDQEVDAYLDDLVARQRVYQEVVDAKVIELTTNKEYERFVDKLEQLGIAEVVKSRASMSPEAYRQKSIELLGTLNPGRVFQIRMPFDPVARAWHARLTGLTDGTGARLDAANALLPGRINLYALTPELNTALTAAAQTAGTQPADSPAFREQAVAFLERATNGHYRVRDGNVEALELTAIYPAGTLEGTTTYKGETLPAFGVTGVWPLIARTQGRGLVGMVDYISPNPGYGFITMLPYQHAGGISYNAFHNAGVRCGLGETPFLPSQWRKVMGERDPSKPYQNLWIISRGPTSHGCTRIASGHMSELRQILPTSSDVLEEVDTFRNLPQCYDVFDIDGNGTAEVMGVQYYLAFKSNGHTPSKAYVSNKRDPFYRWLYGNNVALGPVGQVTLKAVPVCTYAGRKALEAETLSDQPLYEAEFVPESIQFYRIKPVAFDSASGFEFNRELRKVGAGHTVDRKKLLLKKQ